MPSWTQISVVVSASQADALGDALSERGALAVTMEDAADEPVLEPLPGSTPLWSATRVTGLFDVSADFEALAARLSTDMGLDSSLWRRRTVEDEDWERAWMARFKPLRCGSRLWICPHHHEVPPDAEVVVHLDPGLAFGTGTHPTTALCLEALDTFAAAGDQVLDYGCGSGILAIAALKLDAAHATAVDIDPQALLATRDNAVRNGVEDRITVELPRAGYDGEADLVVANILAGPLRELAPVLAAAARDGAMIILSGILTRQVDEVTEAYASCFDMLSPECRDDWACLRGRRRPR